MLFSSIVFLFYFLPAVLLLYYLFRRWTPVKNGILLIASLFFYAWGEPWFVLIMLASIVMNYILALLVDRYREQQIVKFFLALTVVLNIGLLFVFKYLDFFLRNIGQAMNRDLPLTNLALPIGISFFTFQALSYVLDVYRKNGKVQKNPFYVALYIAFFPQLIAGPIVRYASIDEQIVHRKETWDKFSVGVCRFIAGMGKKVLLSNNFAIVADRIFDSYQMGGMPVTLAWLGSIAYTLQILFDFSGYSDMAIGLGRMFHVELPLNFDSPYRSCSIKEFWQRWHITLSRFFITYVYIPLGGSRRGRARMLFNTFIVFLLSGLWHGAAWTYVAWGAMQGMLVVLDNLGIVGIRGREEKRPSRFHIPAPLGWVITFTLFNLSLFFFRSSSMLTAGQLFKNLLSLRFNGKLFEIAAQLDISEIYVLKQALELAAPAAVQYLYLFVMLALFVLAFYLIFHKNAYERATHNELTSKRCLGICILFIWCVISLSQVSTFLYFNF